MKHYGIWQKTQRESLGKRIEQGERMAVRNSAAQILFPSYFLTLYHKNVQYTTAFEPDDSANIS
jgi:predicted amidohydrolase